MWEGIANEVTVPDVVGLPFHVGRDLAAERGVALAGPDPDGPPIGALAWPGLFYIVRQSPAAGAVVTRHSSVVVEISALGDDAGVGAARHPSPRPSLDAFAMPSPPDEQGSR
jgi:hypothetical protein